MIYTVTLNPSIDYIVEVKSLNIGGLSRMERELKLPGGKGINVSRVLNQLGAENVATGFLGGFTGRYIDEKLKEEQLTTDFVYISGDTRINIKLKAGEETEINSLGPDIGREEAGRLFDKLSGLQEGDIVILSGSVPPSLGGDFYERLIGVCKQKGADFVIDTTGEPLMKALKDKPLLVKPNHHELAELFGLSPEIGIAELTVYGRRLLELGAQHVLVSMAGEGALFITESAVFHATVPAGKVRNSVGAGDSMIAGFVGALVRTGDAVQAFRTGVASGSATAFSDDLATKEQIEQLLSRVVITGS